MDTKPVFSLLQTNGSFYVKIALYVEVMQMKYGRFGHGFLSKEQSGNTGASPILF